MSDVMAVLKAWVSQTKFAENAVVNLNEHYLHHEFSNQFGFDGRVFADLEEEEMLHPEWPTRKLVHGVSGEQITYSAEECAYSSDASRGAGHIDFAVGKLKMPHTLIEFKWNDAYNEWQFDFLKMLDPRLAPKRRIFFGVLPRGWHNQQEAERYFSAKPLNDRLSAAIEKSALAMSKRSEKPNFEARFYCVAVGVAAGGVLKNLVAGSNRMLCAKISAQDIVAKKNIEFVPVEPTKAGLEASFSW